MRMLIGLILFWLSTLGYMFLLNKKTKINYLLLFPLSLTLITVVVYIGGLLNIILETSIILCLCGCILFFYYIINRKYKIRKLINMDFIIIFVSIVFFTIISSKLHLIEYDNFSHWALMIKTMFINNGFPNYLNEVITFREYQPGSACFAYYFGLIVGKTESNMILSQNILLISYFFSLLSLTNNGKNKKNIYKLLLVFAYLFVLFFNINYCDLLVDTLLSVISICSFAIMFNYKNDLQKCFLYTLPLSIFMFLVKNTGIVLVVYNCLALLLISIKNKEFINGLKYAVVTGISSLIAFFLWSKHVSYGFGTLGAYSKHAFSFENMLRGLQNKGVDRIFEFISIYFTRFLDIIKNPSNLYIIGIVMLLFLVGLLYKNNMKKVLECIIISIFMYISYGIVLCVMYLVSMPWGEAVILACFNRYLFTIILVIMGISLIYIISILINNKFSIKSMIVILIITALSFVININKDNLKLLVGIQGYENTIAYRVDKIIEEIDDKNDTFYYVYTPQIDESDNGYLKFYLSYKLNTSNIIIIKNSNDLNNIKYANTINRFIIIDRDVVIKDYLIHNNFNIINDNYYELNNINLEE